MIRPEFFLSDSQGAPEKRHRFVAMIVLQLEMRQTVQGLGDVRVVTAERSLEKGDCPRVGDAGGGLREIPLDMDKIHQSGAGVGGSLLSGSVIDGKSTLELRLGILVIPSFVEAIAEVGSIVRDSLNWTTECGPVLRKAHSRHVGSSRPSGREGHRLLRSLTAELASSGSEGYILFNRATV